MKFRHPDTSYYLCRKIIQSTKTAIKTRMTAADAATNGIARELAGAELVRVARSGTEKDCQVDTHRQKFYTKATKTAGHGASHFSSITESGPFAREEKL